MIGDPTFCDRLPDQAVPAPAALIAEYRRHARAYRAAIVVRSFAQYRAAYLTERHLARLACPVREGGPNHRRAFLELLLDDLEVVR